MFFFISVMMIYACGFSQIAKEETIPFDKRSVPGVSIEVPGYDVKVTAAALQDRLERSAKLKGSSMKGFRYYQSQPFSEFGTLNYDIYTQVVTVGKKKYAKTAVYLLVSKGNENFVTPTSDPELVHRMKGFLNHFVTTHLRQYDIDQKTQEQTKMITKLEKENKTLISDRDKLKQQLDDKEKAILTKQDELTNAKNALSTLKESR